MLTTKNQSHFAEITLAPIPHHSPCKMSKLNWPQTATQPQKCTRLLEQVVIHSQVSHFMQGSSFHFHFLKLYKLAELKSPAHVSYAKTCTRQFAHNYGKEHIHSLVDPQIMCGFSRQYKLPYLSAGGSSLIISHTGHSAVLDDLNTATPSVLRVNETFSGLFKKECFRYSFPQYTSKTSVDDQQSTFFWWVSCSAVHMDSSKHRWTKQWQGNMKGNTEKWQFYCCDVSQNHAIRLYMHSLHTLNHTS